MPANQMRCRRGACGRPHKSDVLMLIFHFRFLMIFSDAAAFRYHDTLYRRADSLPFRLLF